MDTDWALAATAFACVTTTEISWLPSMDLFSPNLRTLLLRRQDHRQPSTTKSSTWTSYSGGSCSLVLTVKTRSKPRAPFPLLHARVVTHPSSPTLPQPAPCRFSSSLRALSGTCWFPFCPLWRLDYGHNFADAARLPRSPAAAAMPPRIWMPNVRMRLKLRPAPSESGRVAMPVCFERFSHRSPAEMWGRISAIEVGTRPVCNARASHYGLARLPMPCVSDHVLTASSEFRCCPCFLLVVCSLATLHPLPRHLTGDGRRRHVQDKYTHCRNSPPGYQSGGPPDAFLRLWDGRRQAQFPQHHGRAPAHCVQAGRQPGGCQEGQGHEAVLRQAHVARGGANGPQAVVIAGVDGAGRGRRRGGGCRPNRVGRWGRVSVSEGVVVRYQGMTRGWVVWSWTGPRCGPSKRAWANAKLRTKRAFMRPSWLLFSTHLAEWGRGVLRPARCTLQSFSLFLSFFVALLSLFSRGRPWKSVSRAPWRTPRTSPLPVCSTALRPYLSPTPFHRTTLPQTRATRRLTASQTGPSPPSSQTARRAHPPRPTSS